MIPRLIKQSGAPWDILPPGIHLSTLSEIENAFATNPHRRKLYKGLIAAAKALKDAGCNYLFIDGSYVTGKPRPGDYDGCWDPSGVNRNLLDPVLLDFSNSRQNQKNKYLGELFPFNATAKPGRVFLEFFQEEKFSGKKKGILAIDLKSEPFDSNKGDIQ